VTRIYYFNLSDPGARLKGQPKGSSNAELIDPVSPATVYPVYEVFEKANA
jgi:hypothetical protein